MKPRHLFLLLASSLAAFVHAGVPSGRIREAAREPGNWLTYSGDYQGRRYSGLDEINTKTVGALRPVWIYQLPSPGAFFECTPIVADGVMYIVEPPTTVTALDAQTGRRFWSWTAPMPDDVLAIGFPKTNHGVAVLDDLVIVGTLDAHLVALDARSGVVRWKVTVADNKVGYAITGAPLAVEGRIIIGISGGEAGVRGFLDAYDAKTGARLWRTWTIPAKGEPGNETWDGESWRTGGAPTWLTGAYDPELKLLYWGTGNPAPDWNGDKRAGDNLHACSLLAFDIATGVIKWHFQFTPHDTHDWDANQIPVLVDAEVQGRKRQLVTTANRNGYYYVLDRVTGEFLSGVPFVKQTWSSGLDAKGRPQVLPNTEPSEEGALVWPSQHGGVNWYSPSYSPATGLFYVAAREMKSRYFKGEAEYKPGKDFRGGGEQRFSGESASGAVRALAVGTGALQWEYPLHSPPWAGLLSTAGGLVFGGSEEGNFFALDAATGTALWEFQTGAAIKANPMAFQAEGGERIAIATGNVLMVFGL